MPFHPFPYLDPVGRCGRNHYFVSVNDPGDDFGSVSPENSLPSPTSSLTDRIRVHRSSVKGRSNPFLPSDLLLLLLLLLNLLPHPPFAASYLHFGRVRRVWLMDDYSPMMRGP